MYQPTRVQAQGARSAPESWELVVDAYPSLSELLSHFELFARDALALAALPPASRVLDVATGRVPTTLVHGDFDADNVIGSAHSASPVIIDWTDGARSHPFFDLLIFLRGRAAKRVAAQREALVRAYLSEWTEAGVGSVGNPHEAFTVAQRLAPLYHAGSYRRVFGIGTAAATEFAEALPWLRGLLVEASPP